MYVRKKSALELEKTPSAPLSVFKNPDPPVKDTALPSDTFVAVRFVDFNVVIYNSFLYTIIVA